MNEPTLNYVPCARPSSTGAADQPRMAYWQWGSADASRVVVCVHGLTRQGRDFDTLAQALCSTSAEPLRVVCPDVVGRGQSDWLKDPMGYQIPLYVGDMLALLAQLHAQAPIRTLDWVGTSMGGLIGLILCGQADLPLPAPVRRLVLNDVGPAIEHKSIERIASYLGQTGRFTSLEQAADAMWAISTSFGPHTREQWLQLSRPMVRVIEGTNPPELTLHYDPAISVPVRLATPETSQQGAAMLWALYDQIRAQTLVLRGAESDLLSSETALAMTQRGPRAQLVEFAGVGHAPTLQSADQVQTVTAFMQGPGASGLA